MKNKLLLTLVVLLLLSSCSDYEPLADNTSNVAVLSSVEISQTAGFD